MLPVILSKSGFNGAAVIDRGKPGEAEALELFSEPLQWGRGHRPRKAHAESYFSSRTS